MTRTSSISRRQFLRQTAAASVAAMAVPLIVPAHVLGADEKGSPNNRINMGVIGTGNQGTNDMKEFLKDNRVQIVAVCDVNQESPGYWNGAVAGLQPAKRIVETHYAEDKKSGKYKGCDTYTDFRELLARKDIDVVLIATPDHWHAILVIEACKAGKDIYGQKPLSLTVSEGRAMADAVKNHKRIFQTGSQQRSDPNFRKACELVRNGRIGKLQTVRVGLPGGRPDFGKTGDHKKSEPVPRGFDYEFWLGPAPKAPYAPARCHVNFRWIYDYSGGQVTDWGAHHVDCAQWGMGTQLTGPIEISKAKGVFAPDELWNTATEFYFEAIYENGVKLIVGNKEKNGVTWEGSEGSVFANRGTYSTTPATIKDSKIGKDDVHLYESDNHYRNFIDCVLSRKEPAAPIEVAHRSITICHLGNIAMRLEKEKIKWDPAKEIIVGNAEAAKMLSRAYREPWKMG